MDKRVLAIVCGVSAFVVILWLLFFTGFKEQAPRTAPAPAAAAPVEEAPPVEPVPAPVRTVAPVSKPEPVDLRAEIRGRLLRPNGKPVDDVTLDLSAWQANSRRMDAWQEAHPGEEPPTSFHRESGAQEDGRFSIRFDPLKPFQYSLDTRHDWFVPRSWRWGEVETG